MVALAYRLMLVHRKLEAAIAEERRRAAPDGLRIQRLKKLKLAVKDRMAFAMRATRMTKAA